MELWQYIAKRKVTERKFSQRKLANQLGITYCHLSRIINYETYPGVRLAEKVESVTNGEIKAGDFLKLCYEHVKLKNSYKALEELTRTSEEMGLYE